MGRPLKKNPTEVMINIRVTMDERLALDEIVEARNRELATQGLAMTLTGLIRGLIRREIEAHKAAEKPAV